MRIWILKEGEPLPCDEGNPRLFRAGMFAKALSERGHDVTFWSSTFDHANKKRRFSCDTDCQVTDSYKLKLIFARDYKKNMSLQRIIHQRETAKKFYKKALKEEKPDVIICAMPTIDFLQEAIRYSKVAKVPVIADIRDLWPDIFEDLAPKKLKFAARILTKLLRPKLSKALSQTKGILGLTENFLNWGLNYAKREKTRLDRVFPMAYAKESATADKEFFCKYGIKEDDFICTFFGHLGNSFDMDTIIECAKLTKDTDIKYVICGAGQILPDLEEKAKLLSNVIFTGWIDADKIAGIKSIATVGLLPYKNINNYKLNIPNKFAEYLSDGLILANATDGIMRDTAEKENIGFHYKDAEDLAKKLISLKNSDREEIQKIKERSKKYYDENFDAKKVYSDFCEMIEKEVKK